MKHKKGIHLKPHKSQLYSFETLLPVQLPPNLTVRILYIAENAENAENQQKQIKSNDLPCPPIIRTPTHTQ